MDILYLVDRLEAVFGKGWRIPMSSKTLLDEDEFFDIADQMRTAIPEEIRQAKKIVQDRDQIIAQAKEEATRISVLAHEDAAHLINEHAITKAAQAQAHQIEKQAHDAALATRLEADSYTTQTLSDLQAQLTQVMQQIAVLQKQVSNGIDYISTQNIDNPELLETKTASALPTGTG